MKFERLLNPNGKSMGFQSVEGTGPESVGFFITHECASEITLVDIYRIVNAIQCQLENEYIMEAELYGLRIDMYEFCVYMVDGEERSACECVPLSTFKNLLNEWIKFRWPDSVDRIQQSCMKENPRHTCFL